MRTFFPPEFSTHCLYCDTDRIRATPATRTLQFFSRDPQFPAMILYAVRHFACGACSRAWAEKVEQR